MAGGGSRFVLNRVSCSVVRTYPLTRNDFRILVQVFNQWFNAWRALTFREFHLQVLIRRVNADGNLPLVRREGTRSHASRRVLRLLNETVHFLSLRRR